MTAHDRAIELAAAAIDFDLDPTEREELDRHLADCEGCRSTAAALRSDATALEALPPLDAPDRLREHIATLADGGADLRAGSQERSPAATPAADRGRIIPFADRFRRPAMLATAAAVIVAVVAGGLAWRGIQPNRGIAEASPTPRPTPTAGTTPSPDGFQPVAELTARAGTGSIVPLEAGFRLASLAGEPAAELAERLTVEPKVELSVATDGASAVILTPTEPLIAGEVYRFTLSGPSGEALDSWAFQAEGPVRVVSTLPDNRSSDVPIDTGIEITFDQDGVADAASHVTIEPATEGRFEQRDRVLVFIPESLRPATVYTVTVSAGVAVEATGEEMAADHVFRFETAAATEPGESNRTYDFQDEVYESATDAAPVIGLWAFSPDEPSADRTRIDVYRLADLDAAVDAYQSLREFADWTRWTREGLVATDGLTRVLSIEATLNESRGALWFSLPEPLPAGWYLVEQPDGTRPSQVILQVTDIAGYLAVSETNTMVWANDLSTRDPIVGATVTAEGAPLGATDASGLLLAETPEALIPNVDGSCQTACHPVVTVRSADGRAAFLPAVDRPDKRESFNDAYWSWGEADSRHWLLLETDRSQFRRTDTVNVWGAVRERDGGRIPETVELRLTSNDGIGGAAPIATIRVRPSPTGVYAGSLPIEDLPEGWYAVRLVVDGDELRSILIQVTEILKPAYRLEAETGRRVYVAGDNIRITTRASFFEGTPVPGVPLRIGGTVEADVVTDAQGTAIHRIVAASDGDFADDIYRSVHVSPARAEEGEIAGAGREFVIYPSRRTIEADGTIDDGRVRVAGTVHTLDIDRLERELEAGGSIWELDPAGDPVGGATVTVEFIELIPQTTQIGTEYDFIEKRVVPIFSFDIVQRSAGSQRLRTAGDGTFAASIAQAADHDYRIVVRVADADGLTVASSAYAADSTFSLVEEGQGALLDLTTPRNPSEPVTFAVGEEVDLTMHDPDVASGDGSRYLFFVAQRGLREAAVQGGPRYRDTFEAWAVPNADVGSVRFTGNGYVGARFHAQFRVEDRRLDVGLTVAEPRYAPGDAVTVGVTTRDAAGRPIPATVVLRAIDEKLFAISAAMESDPLSSLYASVQSGIFGTYRTHRHPLPVPEGGDTTGGGGDERADFRDTLLFQTIETDASGRGSATFELSDDLTSWRVLAAGLTTDLHAGQTSIEVPVGLPFFVEATIAPEYLASDRPTILARAFGTDLEPETPVTIQVTSTDLGLAGDPIAATAFETVGMPLPPLSVGTHEITITATTGTGAAARTDRLTRTITVVGTRLGATRTDFAELTDSAGVPGGGDGLTTVLVTDAGAGRALPLLVELTGVTGARLDRALAAEIAATLLEERFGRSADEFRLVDFDPGRYQAPDGGMTLLPYSGSDLELSALVAIVAPDRAEADRLAGYLRSIATNVAETRERQIVALAGLASLGDPVLPRIQAAAADPELTIRERLFVALGAASMGDLGTARAIGRDLVETYGETLGATSRLRVGGAAADSTDATALMALLAAATGDTRAAAFWAYVEVNPRSDRLYVLHAAGYLERTIARTPVEEASFAWTLDGQRTVVELEPGESFGLTLTPDQRDDLRLERLDGAIGVTTTWREPIAAASFEDDPDLELTRSIEPSGRIGVADLVVVRLQVTFGALAPTGCHQLTDLVPSGLRPVGNLAAWLDEENGELPPDVVMPYAQTGQRVFFCAAPDQGRRTVTLAYYARVITPGSYTWEPAVLESRSAPDRAAVTTPREIEIR